MEHELNATAIQRSRMSESLSISSNMSFIVGKKARREEDVIEVEEDTPTSPSSHSSEESSASSFNNVDNDDDSSSELMTAAAKHTLDLIINATRGQPSDGDRTHFFKVDPRTTFPDVDTIRFPMPIDLLSVLSTSWSLCSFGSSFTTDRDLQNPEMIQLCDSPFGLFVDLHNHELRDDKAEWIKQFVDKMHMYVIINLVQSNNYKYLLGLIRSPHIQKCLPRRMEITCITLSLLSVIGNYCSLVCSKSCFAT